jgi:hypothetical protein
MTTPDLADAVIEAFAGVPRPAPGNIAPHPCEECVAIEEYLDGRNPFGLDEEALLGCIWDMPLLSAEAKRFHLPVWLLASVRGSAGSDATDALVFALDSDRRWDPEGGYTEAQRAVLVRYLEAMLENLDDETGFFWPFLQRALERWAGWLRPTE